MNHSTPKFNTCEICGRSATSLAWTRISRNKFDEQHQAIYICERADCRPIGHALDDIAKQYENNHTTVEDALTEIDELHRSQSRHSNAKLGDFTEASQ